MSKREMQDRRYNGSYRAAKRAINKCLDKAEIKELSKCGFVRLDDLYSK